MASKSTSTASTATDTDTAATATPTATAEERVWVRILKSGVHAEGGRFRAGARVKVAASIAERMVADKVASRLPNYY